MYYEKKVKEHFKRTLNMLKFAISKDETRQQLMGVCHVSSVNALCSTNGHVLAHIGSRYDENLADKIINAEYQTIDRDYPKLEPVIPNNDKMTKFEIKIMPSDHWKIKLPKAANKEEAQENLKLRNIYLHLDKDKDEYYFSRKKEDDKFILTFNAEYLKPVADGHTYTVFYSGELSPVKIYPDIERFPNDFYIVMPVRS